MRRIRALFVFASLTVALAGGCAAAAPEARESERLLAECDVFVDETSDFAALTEQVVARGCDTPELHAALEAEDPTDPPVPGPISSDPPEPGPGPISSEPPESSDFGGGQPVRIDPEGGECANAGSADACHACCSQATREHCADECDFLPGTFEETCEGFCRVYGAYYDTCAADCIGES